MEGQLFSSDFLLRGIAETDAWRLLPEVELDAFISALKGHFAPFSAASTLNESQTENELVEPVLDLLGWENAWISQVNLSVSGREDVPDFLLFAAPENKIRALDVGDAERARHGVALLEAKRWLRPLDRSEEGGTNATRKQRDFGAPSSQMLRYLSRADVMSDRAIKWGILTNGGTWRLYWQDARSRAEEFFEIDLAALLGVPGTQIDLPTHQLDADGCGSGLARDGALQEHPSRASPLPPNPTQIDCLPGTLTPRDGLKIFLLFFGRASFLPQAWDSQRRSFHAIALEEARLYQETVSALLGQRVFDDVFPALCQVLASGDLQAEKDRRGQYSIAYLEEVREAALILLYRLLFLFYAEDRRLLPVVDARYASYSLSALRDEIAQALDSGKVLSIRISTFWDKLRNLFSMIDEGDDSLGMPAYNGGLFERGRSLLLERIRVPDASLAPAIDALSRRTDLLKARINYRDLSVTHLGGVYERLLEYKLQQEGEFPQWYPRLFVAKAGFARKGSGSYYTHDALVRLVLDESVGRLTAERQDEFDRLLAKYRKKAELKPYEWDALEAADPASRFLDLKICDPAMGSGHFLVALVDWLADRTLEAAQSAASHVGECAFAAHLEEKGRPWVSPIVSRIAEIRRRIAQEAEKHGWTLDLRQLDDRHIVRRMILKRVVFGVDKNPMAVELAKVGLWLHTFTVGAPLSFLNHHLQCGDSLHGEKLASVRAGMAALGSLFQEGEMSRLQIAAKSLEAVADLTDTSIAEAHESKRLADEAGTLVAPVHGLLDFWRGLRWRVPGWPQAKLAKLKDEDIKLALSELFSDRYNLIAIIAAGKIDGESEPGTPIAAANRLLADLAALARRERFFHWQTAFPNVWPKGADAYGGFDAIIGNPPWDRIKMQEVEWFAERKPEIALQTRAADRKTLIEKEQKRRTPLWRDYLVARDAAESGARAIRECGEFPLLSGGDTNLYSLFVERATALVAPQGIVGLLTPSGIAADKGASDFFRTLTEADDANESGAAKLAALFDFENRKVFFPDIDSRFKFCALIFGGEARLFAQSRCAFYLHDTAELADPARILALSAQDFRLLNPNTGAAPLFRSQRDADLTMRIYRQHPVLVDRSGNVEKRVWPLRYVRMFDMTNDSHLFLKKRQEDSLPLYEGKMVQMYDHRAADVVLNKANLHRAAQQESIPEAIKVQPDRYPVPQYWVAREEVDKVYAGQWALGFKSITAPTNVRTMISAILPHCGVGNSMGVLLPVADTDTYALGTSLLVANLNSIVFDFVLRQKVQGQNLNLYLLEQIPLIAPAAFEAEIGGTKIADFIRAEVLALSYTAHDLAPFARDLGYVD
ncbi:MAG: restriction endonuclease, partial [Betaproteobacteria bacterium]|nr:restriction endonuclease [Betaproteobacteria bacterium]